MKLEDSLTRYGLLPNRSPPIDWQGVDWAKSAQINSDLADRIFMSTSWRHILARATEPGYWQVLDVSAVSS